MMSSMSGYITYIEYLAGKDKGETHNGDLFNNPFQLGNVDPNYTSDRVVETAELVDGQAQLAWFPVREDSVKAVNPDVVVTVVDAEKGIISWDTAFGTALKVKYVYDNIVVPQNDLPTLRAEMKSIPLVARARRIAVFYSQMAAYQAKTDYGFDLGSQLAEKAVGQLSYEIDTEVTQLLIDNAVEDTELIWSKTLPIGISKQEHYQGFSELVEIGRQKIYDLTKRFSPNYMLVASNLLPVLSFINGWTAAPSGQINGPYYAGQLNSLKVYVTPNIAPGHFVIGCNGDDYMSSAAVYAPYMAIVPTQLLQYADGGSSQGWSTLYDLKLLNKNLLVQGHITE